MIDIFPIQTLIITLLRNAMLAMPRELGLPVDRWHCVADKLPRLGRRHCADLKDDCIQYIGNLSCCLSSECKTNYKELHNNTANRLLLLRKKWSAFQKFILIMQNASVSKKSWQVPSQERKIWLETGNIQTLIFYLLRNGLGPLYELEIPEL